MLSLRKIQALSMILTLLVAAAALGQDTQQPQSNPWSYGGTCSSQGVWTRAALDATHQIAKVINDLKDDKNCKGLKENLLALSKDTEEVVSSVGTDKQAERLGELPNEISSLRSAISSDGGLKTFGLKMLMSKNLENAALTAQAGANPFTDILALKARVGATTSRGLELAQAVATRLPDMDRCMMNSEQNMAMALGGAMQLVSAFVSSGNGYSTKLSQTLLTLASVMRDRRYTRILRKLNTADFWTSMSCMVETASEAWCTVRDMQNLFKEGINDLQTKVVDQKITGFDDPFQGYYILVNEVPYVTNWIQKIQIGVEPRLTSDAAFKDGILDTINAHLKKVNDVQGNYNNGLQTLETYGNDSAGKRMGVFQLLQTLTGIIAPQGLDDVGQRTNMNFFIRSMTPEYIPFFLIGMSEIPAGVQGGARLNDNQIATDGQSWTSWMQNGGAFAGRSQFNDPDQLAKTIGVQLKKLIDQSNDLAIAYYNKWFIVDKPTLVNESIMDTRYSVVEVLTHIRSYLDRLQARVLKYHGDAAIIPEIVQTRAQINDVLNSYDSVRALAKMIPREDNSSAMEAYQAKVLEAYAQVADMVFKRFNVLQQRAGYIANRMSMFVYYDYSLMIRNNPDLTNYQREIYVAAGQSIMERLIQLYSGNPANVKSDLETASSVNKNTLEAIESLVRDSMYATMVEFKMRAEDKRPTNGKIAWNSFVRMFKDEYVPRPVPGGKWWQRENKTEFEKEHPVRAWLQAFFPQYAALTSWWYPKWFHPDLYPMHAMSIKDFTGLDDENNTNREILARLCTQSLAFENWSFFANICQNTKLHSPFSPELVTSLKTNYFPGSTSLNGYSLDVDYNSKAHEGLNTSTANRMNEKVNAADRICAFRDYNRRNLIVWLTLQEIQKRQSRASGE